MTPPVQMRLPPLPRPWQGYDKFPTNEQLEHYERAKVALEQGDFALVREYIAALLQEHPNHSYLLSYLAGIALTAEEQYGLLQPLIDRGITDYELAEALIRVKDALKWSEAAHSEKRLQPGQDGTRRVVCPHCGGSLILRPGEDEVKCEYCGERNLNLAHLAKYAPDKPLIVGIVQRRDIAEWQIGEHWVQCDSCGALMTANANRLAETCQFCGARYVVRQTAQHRFEQPDYVIPFQIDEQKAHATAAEALEHPGFIERLREGARPLIFIDVRPVYLPFWLFSATMQLTSKSTNYSHVTNQTVALENIPFFGASTPDRKLLREIEPFNMTDAVAYDPRLLSEHPAQLYTLDLERASMLVRDTLHRKAKEKAFDAGAHAMTLEMGYRLGLFPVWTIYALEVHGGTRVGVINGQTGKMRLASWVERHK